MGIWNSIPSCRSLSPGVLQSSPCMLLCRRRRQHRPEVSFAKVCSSIHQSTSTPTPTPTPSLPLTPTPGCVLLRRISPGRTDRRRGGRPSGRLQQVASAARLASCYLQPLPLLARSWTHLGALAWLLPLLAAGQIDRSSSGSRAYFR